MIQIKAIAAAKSLSERWIPVNTAVHDLVTTKLRKGFYNDDISPLVKDLMADAALFGYCLKNLLRLLRDDRIERPELFNIVSLFQSAGLDHLRSMLGAKPSAISQHNLKDMDAPQLSCLHQMIVSSSTSEMLCEKANFAPGIGYAGALLRQLGLTLIAWNYPHIFRQAIVSVQDGEKLDSALLRLLGYSPRTLAIALAKDWGCTDELMYAVGEKNALPVGDDERSAKIRRAAEVISKSCEVGELLARASHPEINRSDENDWREARRAVEAALGPGGMSLIDERVRSACRSYLHSQGDIISKITSFRLGGSNAPSAIAEALPPAQSQQIDPIPPHLRERLKTLYRHIDPKSLKRESVLIFSQEVVPAAGFSGGCILMFDFESSELVPRFRFGECNIGTQRIPCAALAPSLNPVAEAFRSDRPVVDYNPWSDQKYIGYVAQAFGVIQRVGVLYLEIGREHEASTNEEVMRLFQVLRKSLQDCLGVK